MTDLRKIMRGISVPNEINFNKTAEYNPIDDMNPLDESPYSFNQNFPILDNSNVGDF